MASLNVADVARYFLTKQDASGPADPITNLKLQKLCYYAQGFALVRLQRPLFFDHIEHWQHGPVVPVLWRTYKHLGAAPIPSPGRFLDLRIYSPEAMDILDEVYGIYGSLGAWELRNMTHAEPPWKDTPDGAPITHQKMRSYFENLIDEMNTSGENEYHDNQETLEQSLAYRMAVDLNFMELTERGLSDLAEGRYSTLEEVRRALGDV